MLKLRQTVMIRSRPLEVAPVGEHNHHFTVSRPELNVRCFMLLFKLWRAQTPHLSSWAVWVCLHVDRLVCANTASIALCVPLQSEVVIMVTLVWVCVDHGRLNGRGLDRKIIQSSVYLNAGTALKPLWQHSQTTLWLSPVFRHLNSGRSLNSFCWLAQPVPNVKKNYNKCNCWCFSFCRLALKC